MKLLLDTHTWLWNASGDRKLHPKAKALIGNSAGALWLSSISVMEALLLAEKGRVQNSGDPHKAIQNILGLSACIELPVDNKVIFESRKILLQHYDPFDRLIVATARIYDLTLVTADDTLLRSGACQVLPAS